MKNKIVDSMIDIFSSEPKDIGAAIKLDHKGLRNYLSLLKDTDKKMDERRRAYASFQALLKSHTKAEEQAVYKHTFKLYGKEMHLKVQEGYVEHQLSKDLMKRLDDSNDSLEWSAHANVLAEIVEHHLKEEERDLLPLIKKAKTARLDKKMLALFLAIRLKSQTKINKKNAGVLAKV